MAIIAINYVHINGSLTWKILESRNLETALAIS